ncbi:unnamed protein product, partial [Ectocarpus sp. 13 AM-2016]
EGTSSSTGSSEQRGRKRPASRPKVDAAFLRRISRLLKVMVPGPCSVEAGCLVAVAGLLLARTSLDVVMLNLTTTIEHAIVERSKEGFKRGMSRFVRMCVPIAVVNSVLKYCQSELSLRFRQRLTEHVMSKYMEGFTFYAVSNLDDRIANADQAITQDVERFAASMADLYSNITKPVLDMLIYVRRLSDKVDAVAPATMIAYLLLSGVALSALRKPTAMYTALVAQQEGEYRYVNSRLLTNAQAEIAFYKGNTKEKQVLEGVFDKLVSVTRRSERFRHSLGALDSVVAKYFASLVGWTVVSRPFVNRDHPRHAHSTAAEVYQDYHSSGRMMLKLAAALGRLVLSGRELARLSGFSSRVTGLIDVIDDANRGVFKRGQVPRSPGAAIPGAADVAAGVTAAGADGPLAASVTAVADATAEAEMAAPARITPPRRSPGVSGATLTTEEDGNSPRFAAGMGGREGASGEPGRISSDDGDVSEASPRLTSSLSEPARPSSISRAPADDHPAMMAGTKTAAVGVALGQPELAPEAAGAARASEAAAAAAAAGGGGARGGGGGGRRGAPPLQRSGSVVVQEDSFIEFVDVPLVTPTGEVLVEALSFKVGRHVSS